MTATGAVMRRRPAHAELERWYRWLLWAHGSAYGGDDEVMVPFDGTYEVFQATRNGRVLTGYATTITTPRHAGVDMWVTVRPSEPAWAPAAVALGWLVGAVAGWLLTRWVGYRLRRRTLSRRLAALGLGLTAIGLAAHPTIGLYETLARLAFTTVDIYGIAPPYRWLIASPAAWPVVGTLTAGIGIVLLAATGRRSIPQATAAA